MKNSILVFITFLSVSLLSIQAQDSSHSFLDKVHVGGGFNIGLGSTYSSISITPSVIYDISSVFSAGINATYMYTKNKSASQESNIYGGGLLLLINPMEGFQFSGEYEHLIIKHSFLNVNNTKPSSDALFLGLAYKLQNIAIGLRYDLLYDKQTSIYPSALSPTIRIYF